MVAQLGRLHPHPLQAQILDQDARQVDAGAGEVFVAAVFLQDMTRPQAGSGDDGDEDGQGQGVAHQTLPTGAR